MAPVSYPNNSPKVILLGDSLTEYSFNEEGNWGCRLTSLLTRKAKVEPYGYSGYNSELLKKVLPQLFDRNTYGQIACLTLCIGANDSWFPTNFNMYNPALPVEKYRRNLVEMIEFLLQNGLAKEKILLISPPTYQPAKYVKWCREHNEIPTDKTPEHTRKYVDAMLAVGEQLNIKAFDVFELTDREEHRDQAFVDGLHFSNYGANLLFELIKSDVDQLVEKYRGTSRMNFPLYDEVDFNNLEFF